MRNKKTVVLLVSLIFSSLFLHAQVKHKPALSPRMRLLESIARGKKVYVQYCLTCHQADASGVQNMNPPLIHTIYVLGNKTRLITIILNGFNEDVAINGQTYSNNMPPHNNLTNQQIADVLTYVRNNFTNKASRVTFYEVKRARAMDKKLPSAAPPAAN